MPTIAGFCWYDGICQLIVPMDWAGWDQHPNWGGWQLARFNNYRWYGIWLFLFFLLFFTFTRCCNATVSHADSSFPSRVVGVWNYWLSRRWPCPHNHWSRLQHFNQRKRSPSWGNALWGPVSHIYRAHVQNGDVELNRQWFQFFPRRSWRKLGRIWTRRRRRCVHTVVHPANHQKNNRHLCYSYAVSIFSAITQWYLALNYLLPPLFSSVFTLCMYYLCLLFICFYYHYLLALHTIDWWHQSWGNLLWIPVSYSHRAHVPIGLLELVHQLLPVLPRGSWRQLETIRKSQRSFTQKSPSFTTRLCDLRNWCQRGACGAYAPLCRYQAGEEF